MNYETEINELKAALLESMLGAAGLVTCVVQSLGEVDPRMQERVSMHLRQWHRNTLNRPRKEAKILAEMVGRAIDDPAFPTSSGTS
jgi:hypothetical protein